MATTGYFSQQGLPTSSPWELRNIEGNDMWVNTETGQVQFKSPTPFSDSFYMPGTVNPLADSATGTFKPQTGNFSTFAQNLLTQMDPFNGFNMLAQMADQGALTGLAGYSEGMHQQLSAMRDKVNQDRNNWEHGGPLGMRTDDWWMMTPFLGALGGMLGAGASGAAGAENAATGATAAEGATTTGVSAGAGPEVAATPGSAGSMFGPGAAETLDASLIGPYSGAAPGSGSVFAAPITSTFEGASSGTFNPQTGAPMTAGAGGVSGASGVGGAGAGTSVLSNPQVLGMLGGAALAAGGGGTKPAGTININEGIPDWLMPYVKPTLDKYSTEVQNYNVDPYGIMPSAMKEFQNTINGMYLDPSTNKYLEDYFKLGAERIKGALSPTFGHMQAFGQNSGYNEALARGLGDFSVGLYGGAYERERDRQNQMIGGAPNFLGTASNANFAPYSTYLNTVGNMGKKREEPYFSNPFGNILGGAMAGGMLGKVWGS